MIPLPARDLVDLLAGHGWEEHPGDPEGGGMDDRSIYVFASEGPTPEELVKIPGIRCAATLAHPAFGLFVGGWADGDWLAAIRPQLGNSVAYDEPIPDYPPSWPTRIVHRKPSALAYHALSFETALPARPFLEEASLLFDGTVLCLWGSDDREDLRVFPTNPIFLTSWAYDTSEALV